jgi:hypothetical protein
VTAFGSHRRAAAKWRGVGDQVRVGCCEGSKLHTSANGGEVGEMGVFSSSTRSVGNPAPDAAPRAGATLDIPRIETVPSVREKTAQWNAACARLNECDAQIKRAKDSRNSAPASIEERAAKSLRGEPISTSGPKEEDLSARFEERQVLAAAVNMAKELLDEAKGAASVDLCTKISAEHQVRVKETAACAIAMATAVESEADFFRQIRAAGYQVTEPITHFPALGITLGGPGDWNSPLGVFLRVLRAKGLKV